MSYHLLELYITYMPMCSRKLFNVPYNNITNLLCEIERALPLPLTLAHTHIHTVATEYHHFWEQQRGGRCATYAVIYT